MTAPISADDARRLADDILETDAWFRRLPAANKDMLSQPNHDANQADKAKALARRVSDLAAEVERLSADNERLREALRHIASEDYRGPQPHCAVIAAAALDDEGEK